VNAGPSLDLETFFLREGEEVEQALERSLESLADDVATDLAGPVRHAVMSGGKRLRPILCVVAHRSCGGITGSAVYDLGVAIELVHAYSLMHDDLPCMDDAELRRGRPTPHTLFGEEATIRAGLALIPAASRQALRAARALECDDDTVRAIVQELNCAAGGGGMVGGQYLDLLAEGLSLGSGELDDLHRRKTGALLTASLVIGGLAAGTPESVLTGLRGYGRAVGLAFQVTDDVLDETSSVADLGKHPSDGLRGKSTYVSLYGVDEALQRARMLTDEALGALGAAEIEAPELVALAHYVVERKR
jgi:geranylgeranyl pyrophosphate synthase